LISYHKTHTQSIQVAAATARARPSAPPPLPTTAPQQGQQPNTRGTQHAPLLPPLPSQLPGCADGEMCGHSLRPGVLLQSGQTTVATFTLRPPPLPSASQSQRHRHAAGPASHAQGGVDAELSEVPLFSTCLPITATAAGLAGCTSHPLTGPLPSVSPSPAVPSSAQVHRRVDQAGPDSFHAVIGDSCHANDDCGHGMGHVPSLQGAGMAPLSHPSLCPCPATPTPSAFALVAPPPHMQTPSLHHTFSCTTDRLGGPLGHWHGHPPHPATLPTHMQEHLFQQPSKKQQAAAAAAAAATACGAQHSAAPKVPGSVDPAVDVAVVWCVPEPAAGVQSTSCGAADNGNVQAGVGQDVSSMSSGRSFLSESAQLRGLQLQQQQQQQQRQRQEKCARYGVLWLRNVLPAFGPDLPPVRAVLRLAPASCDAPQSDTCSTVPQQNTGVGADVSNSYLSLEASAEHFVGGSVSWVDSALGSSSCGMSGMVAGRGSGRRKHDRADGSSASACVVLPHDFRQQPVCMLNLQLDVRNSMATVKTIKIQVCVRGCVCACVCTRECMYVCEGACLTVCPCVYACVHESVSYIALEEQHACRNCGTYSVRRKDGDCCYLH